MLAPLLSGYASLISNQLYYLTLQLATLYYDSNYKWGLTELGKNQRKAWGRGEGGDKIKNVFDMDICISCFRIELKMAMYNIMKYFTFIIISFIHLFLYEYVICGSSIQASLEILVYKFHK